MILERAYSFIGGPEGPREITSVRAVIGESLRTAHRLRIAVGLAATDDGSSWVLRGVTSNERYTTRVEKDQLVSIQPPLGREQATCGALIPIRKSATWWSMTQDERRLVFEEQSHHIALGLTRLPAVARRLHHSRDLGEPFDFLTWFEYAPQDASSFESLVTEMRATAEWRFVEREVDIRVRRAGGA